MPEIRERATSPEATAMVCSQMIILEFRKNGIEDGKMWSKSWRDLTIRVNLVW